MRYFGKLAYCGKNYSGWQVQNNAVTVQQKVEGALSLLLNTPIPVMGCGRTDAGVNASNFYFHFDSSSEIVESDFARQVNGVLPNDIVLVDLIPVPENSHARFDATSRTYRYYINCRPDPFRLHSVFYFRPMQGIDPESLEEFGEVLMKYDRFFPFAKSRSEIKHYKCEIHQVKWTAISDSVWVFEITANRFLRGMVRLIVGAALYIGMGKLDIREVDHSLNEQIRLRRPYSVPAHGLYLSEVRYPFIDPLNEPDFFEPFGPISQRI